MLDLIGYHLKGEGIQYVRIDGKKTLQVLNCHAKNHESYSKNTNTHDVT